MRAGIVVNVTPVDRRRLEAIIADRGAPQKHVWRAQIILATAPTPLSMIHRPPWPPLRPSTISLLPTVLNPFSGVEHDCGLVSGCGAGGASGEEKVVEAAKSPVPWIVDD